MAFVALIIGVALIGSVATQTNLATDKLVIANGAHDISAARNASSGTDINESDPDSYVTVTNYPSGWKITDCPLTSVVHGNASVHFTLGSDYTVVLSTGIIHVLETSVTGNSTNATLADYTYCGDDYLNSGWGRSIIGLIAGFFAIALLGVSLFMFYNIFKSTGLIK